METPEPATENPPSEGPEALGQLLKQIPELVEYLLLYLHTQVDRAKLSLKSLLLTLAMGVLVTAFVSAIAVISLWLFFSGLAQGLGEYWGNRLWLGTTVVGGSLIGLTALTVKITLVKIRRGSLKRRMREYERQLQEQKSRYGHSAADQASALIQN